MVPYDTKTHHGSKMAQVQLATRIDKRVKKAIERYCDMSGLKINKFVERALLDKLEELEDIEDVKKLRNESTRPLQDVVKDLKIDGLL